MPWKASILFFLSRNSMPLVLPSTASSLWARIALRSSLGLPTSIPSFLKCVPASSNRCEACRSALEGMQPTFRQVPPWAARFSMTAVFMPKLCRADGADIAAGAGTDDDEIVGHAVCLFMMRSLLPPLRGGPGWGGAVLPLWHPSARAAPFLTSRPCCFKFALRAKTPPSIPPLRGGTRRP